MATTSSTGVDWTMGGLDNPLKVQAALLNRFETETGNTIVDTNNPASVLMEAFASMSSGLVRKIEDTVRPAIYPARATTAVDLYKHLSDYDYVDIFATPASTEITMVVERAYVMDHSVPVPGASYRKLVVPETTRFTLGDHSYGIYYPIELRSNRETGRFTVVYDTSKKNPLKTLTTSTLETETRQYKNMELIYIKIPVYQFDIQTRVDSIVNGTGFKKSFSYANYFYAIRCTAEVLQNPGHDSNEEDIWAEQELGLCVSGQSYNPEEPTVVFTPDLETKTCVVEIPYVYMTKGLIRGNLTTKLYTTEGEITYELPEDTTEICTVDMFSQITDDTTANYAEPFKLMPSLRVVPLGMNVITGGKNGMSFETLKKRVITDTLRSKTLQTPDDINAYFDNQGYVTTLLRDGVTDRVFIAHSTVKDDTGTVISADEIGTLFDFSGSSMDEYNTIVRASPKVYTVLPSTIYKFDKVKGICTPLTISDRRVLNGLSPIETVEEFNNNIYTINPFYLQVDTSSRYPTSITYDMANTSYVSQELMSEREDQNVSCQLTLNTSIIEVVKGDTKDFYRLTFRVGRTGLDDVDAVVTSSSMAGQKNFRVILAFKNASGAYVFGEAEWLSRTDDFDIYTFDILSDYKFKQANNKHTVSLWIKNNASAKGEESDFLLTSEIRVILTAKGTLDAMSGVRKAAHSLNTDFSNVTTLDDLSSFYALSESRMVCRFGSVVNELDQRVNLTYSEMQYKKFSSTRFLTLEQPEFTKDVNGVPVLDIGYFITKDISPAASKLHGENEDTGYYSKSISEKDGTSYNPLKLNTTNFYKLGDKWNFKPGLTYYEKASDEEKDKVFINEKYKVGTMTCLTKTMPELIVNNQETAPNYYGCTYIEADGTEKIFSSETAIHGKEYAFKDAPVIPRFSVVGAHQSSEGDSIALGTYELKDARTHDGGQSRPSDVWLRSGNHHPSVHPAFEISDALRWFWIRNIAEEVKDTDPVTYNKKNVIDNTETPIETMRCPVGTFVLAENCLGYEEGVPEIEIIEDHDIQLAKLYYCYSAEMAGSTVTKSDWVCVGQGKTWETMTDTILVETDDTNVLCRSYGYVYVADLKNFTSDDRPYAQMFVGLLNTKQYKGVTIPDFSSFYVNYDVPESTKAIDAIIPDALYYYKNVNTNKLTSIDIDSRWNKVADITAKSGYVVVVSKHVAGCGWTNRVDKWPWDCTTWMLEQSFSFDADNRWYNYLTDGDFETQFDTARLGKYCAYTSGQYDLDENGELQVLENGERRIQYLVSMVQLDAKLARTTANMNATRSSANKTHNYYPASVASVMRGHFTNLGTIKNSMFTNTRLFWSPLRSLGSGTFKVSNTDMKDLQLDIRVGFRIHVESADAKDEILIKNIKNRLIELTDEHLKEETFSCVNVAKAALAEMGETIKQIDVLGINGDVNLQTLTPTESEVRCHLGHSLELLDDDITIDVSRSLDLEVVAI